MRASRIEGGSFFHRMQRPELETGNFAVSVALAIAGFPRPSLAVLLHFFSQDQSGSPAPGEKTTLLLSADMTELCLPVFSNRNVAEDVTDIVFYRPLEQVCAEVFSFCFEHVDLRELAPGACTATVHVMKLGAPLQSPSDMIGRAEFELRATVDGTTNGRPRRATVCRNRNIGKTVVIHGQESPRRREYGGFVIQQDDRFRLRMMDGVA